MGIAVDPDHPWRGAALAGIPVRRITVVPLSSVRVDGEYNDEAATTDNGAKAFLADYNKPLLADREARNAMLTGLVEVDVGLTTTDVSSVDNAIGLQYTQPYTYSGHRATALHFSHAGRHFSVRPQINETVAEAMYSGSTVDKWAQAASVKLPRVTASSRAGSAVPGLPGDAGAGPPTTTDFEALRRAAIECIRSDDYGDRLATMARLVHHVRVWHTMGIVADPVNTDSGPLYSILSADTVHLSPAQLRNNLYLYTHTEDSDEYRAFLLMSVRGLHNYVGQAPTVYSECRVEVEAESEAPIVFVRTGGEPRSSWAPGHDAYKRVLGNPQLCLGYYYAYARSLGLGGQATAVLVQSALAPHVWNKAAVSPYKNNSPRLDACTYAILPSSDDAHTFVTETTNLVHNAAIYAEAYKAGLGCLLTAHSAGRDVDSAGVVSQRIGYLSDPETRRTIARAVSSLLCTGNVGLEWITPFSYDVQTGFNECVSSWRSSGYLLSLYNKIPVSSLAGCFTTGVVMRNAMIGRKMVKTADRYAQVVMCSLATQCDLPCQSEQLDRAMVARLARSGIVLREWRAVARVVGFRGTPPKNTALERSPPRWAESEQELTSVSTGIEAPGITVAKSTHSSDASQSTGSPPRPPRQPQHTRRVSPADEVRTRPTTLWPGGGPSTDTLPPPSQVSGSTVRVTSRRPGVVEVPLAPITAGALGTRSDDSASNSNHNGGRSVVFRSNRSAGAMTTRTQEAGADDVNI